MWILYAVFILPENIILLLLLTEIIGDENTGSEKVI